MSRISRRQFGTFAALTAGAVTLGGCAPWEYGDAGGGLERLLSEAPPSDLQWRVLNRLGYGPRPGELSQLRAVGVDAWIERQLRPESIEESPELLAALARLESLELAPAEARDRETEWEGDEYLTPLVRKTVKFGRGYRGESAPGPLRQELAQATVLRAAFSTRLLEQLLVEFWSDHFNIDHTKGDCRWLKTMDDVELRRHALGRFGDLLRASAHSPAMLYYLDNVRNRPSEEASVARLNENYARELLELHTLGDTTAYTLADVKEVARVLSGWSVADSTGTEAGRFEFRSADHDRGEKTVLGRKIAAGQGQGEGEQLLDELARHPLTARSICGKLCRRFVGEPPAELHERLVREYLASEGDIRRVLAELFRSDAFRRGEQPLLKRPWHYAVSALRLLGARTSGAGVAPHLEAMGQRPFAWAQPDGYPLRPEPWTAGMLARWTFAVDLASNRVAETWINFDRLRRATRGRSAGDVARRLAEGLLPETAARQVSAALASVDADAACDLQRQVALILASPQFQWC